MTEGLLTVAYLAAAILFIRALGGLSMQETARRGNLFGIAGIVLAILATIWRARPEAYGLIAAVVGAGAVIGLIVAARVAMTAMPQLVAILHSFVGLAAVLVGVSNYAVAPEMEGPARLVHGAEVYLGVFIGAITFTGSVVAFGKLQGVLGSKPLLLPGRHAGNLVLALAALGLGLWFLGADGSSGMPQLLAMTGIAFVLGAHLVWAIGGADMPVVVSVLNSYSGWSAAATGFLLENDLLIVTGALVGSSGAILSIIMCRAMNRSIWNVMFGGFGATTATPVETAVGEVRATTVDETAEMLRQAREVIIVPGYGMAVAQAQHPVHEVTEALRDRGVQVRFAIHPVAGRLPGHMNVLLAEARVPYDIVLEMDRINPDFPRTDVVLIIGANDIVNPAALDSPGSPIYGMPVLEVWKARTVVVLKRSMATGYSGVDNPLFYNENTLMLFGDARATVEAILDRLRVSADPARAPRPRPSGVPDPAVHGR